MNHSSSAESIAVLAVECQNGLLGPDSILPALAADNADLVPNVARLLQGARHVGIRVVHATYEGALGGGQVGTARFWRSMASATVEWRPGSPATEVIPELLSERDLVFPRHHGLYPTLETELVPVLFGLGIKTVVLAGVSINLAVGFTVNHCAQVGFEVVVPRDAVGASPREYRDQVIDHNFRYIARITTIDELLSEWVVTS